MVSGSDGLSEVEIKGTGELLYKLWWKEGLLFSCLGCGRCCRGEPGSVWLSPRESEDIAACLGMERERFLATYVTERRGRKTLRERLNGDCVMYEREGARCRIYGVRPLQCRLFPFWPSVLRTEESWEDHSLECPGMGQGRHWPAEEIAALLEMSPFQDL